MKCKYCGCEEYYCKKVGPHIGAYCKECGKWIKWLPQHKYKQIDDNHIEIVDDYLPYFREEFENDDTCPF